MTVTGHQPQTVSVIIPAFNAEAHLGKCLSSIASQACDCRIEMIVIDDGSTDDTARIARSFPDVTLIQQQNQGPAAARNRGLEAATGELIAFLDSDDLWPAGKLEEQLRILKCNPDLRRIFIRESGAVFISLRRMQFALFSPTD